MISEITFISSPRIDLCIWEAFQHKIRLRDYSEELFINRIPLTTRNKYETIVLKQNYTAL